MKIKLPIGRKLFLTHLLAILFVSGSVGTYFYHNAAHSLHTSLTLRLRNSTAILGVALHSFGFDDIRGPEDKAKTNYVATLEQIRAYQRTNPDIAFVYVMRKEGNRVVFVVDSDSTDLQALPGREYTTVLPELLEGFRRPSVDPQVQKDEWGSFMSGYAPIAGKNGEYLVGIDMRADEVKAKFRRLHISGLISLAGSLVLALLFSRIFSRYFVRHVRLFVRQCHAIAEGRLQEKLSVITGDELDELAEGFNLMSANLQGAQRHREEADAALHKANETLEGRVQERTRELEEANRKLQGEIEERKQVELQREKVIVEFQGALANVKKLSGLLPICAGCKRIKDGQGNWWQLESYVHEHSDARFSHGMCPECVQKYYSDFLNETPPSP